MTRPLLEPRATASTSSKAPPSPHGSALTRSGRVGLAVVAALVMRCGAAPPPDEVKESEDQCLQPTENPMDPHAPAPPGHAQGLEALIGRPTADGSASKRKESTGLGVSGEGRGGGGLSGMAGGLSGFGGSLSAPGTGLGARGTGPGTYTPRRANEDEERSSPAAETAPLPQFPPFQIARDTPLSTFSVDVDRGSFTFARRRLTDGFVPDPLTVRTEEFINALTYAYPLPTTDPFSVSFEGSPSPWAEREMIVRVGVQGRVAPRRPVHLTFLVDTSGSMQGPDRLPMVIDALTLCVRQLHDGDTVAIVVYAGSSGVVLEPTPATEQRVILSALGELQAGGSTAMGAGILTAYQLAARSHQPGHNSRVIIASDGDANVGIVDTDSLSKLIRDHAKTGISLTTLGFGTGNFRDHRMEQLADDGDGNYYYIDGMAEAKRIFIDQLPSTMEAIARDVKIQVEWNPESVHAWRLIGYENRAIADRDFRNDAVDAGEVGSGHSVTALYAIGMVPGATSELGLADVATVRLRYKPPGPDAPSTERAFVMQSSDLHALPSQASADQQVAIAAAAFAERLRGSPYAPPLSYAWLAETVERAHRTDRRDDASIAEMMRAAAKLTHD